MSRKFNPLLLLVCGALTVLMIWSVQRALHISVEKPPDPIRAFFGMRTAKLPACKLNLQQISICKELWASNENKSSNDIPTWNDLRPYIADWVTNRMRWTNGTAYCPAGGTYTIGKVGEFPKCSLGGPYHSL